MKKIADKYRKMSVKELEREEQNLRRELAELKVKVKLSPPKDTNVLSKKRKELAILLTIKSEKQKENN